MLAAGASLFSIVVTTFIVNLRHFLMSSALAVYLNNADRKKLSFFAYGVTDESFAVNLSKFRESEWDLDSALVTNYTANFTWIVTTVLGGIGERMTKELTARAPSTRKIEVATAPERK